MQQALRKIGYTHTQALDQTVTVYHAQAARVEAIMSRRRADDSDVDRAAVAFERRRAGQDWTIISTSLCPTQATRLADAW